MPQPLSIVQVTDQLNVGGAEQVVVMLANLLQAHKHHSAVVTTVAPGPLAAKLHPAVQLTCLQRGWKWNPVTLYKLVQTLKRFDVVHVHSAHNLRYVYLATRLFFLKKRLFYHEHFGNAINTTPNAGMKYLYAQTRFIAVSGKLAAWAGKVAGVPQQQVFLLPNTVAKEAAEPAPQSQDGCRLCIVGNILPNKNILFAFQLLQALQKRKQQLHLTVIGKVADEKYYNQLLRFIKDNDLQQSISFIHHCSNVQSILHQFSAAIHCAHSESGPLVLIEYIAQGLPFVTYHTGEVAEQLYPHLPGWIMHDFDVDKWVQAIDYVMQQPGEKIREQCGQLYEHYYSPQWYYQQCVQIYHKGLHLE